MKEDILQLFLEELAELTQKHKIVIGGCGHCGSPFLYPLGEEPNYSTVFRNDLSFDTAVNRYSVTTPKKHARIVLTNPPTE